MLAFSLSEYPRASQYRHRRWLRGIQQ
uniref:Uncharacterized protein n=1 Tax=Lepeophtheirus salmonis TaxID=72036 RepID=A0A0K2TKZ4_LEPSM